MTILSYLSHSRNGLELVWFQIQVVDFLYAFIAYGFLIFFTLSFITVYTFMSPQDKLAHSIPIDPLFRLLHLSQYKVGYLVTGLSSLQALYLLLCLGNLLDKLFIS